MIVNLATGTATGGDGTDTLIGIEDVTGSAFNDVLTGDAGANSLNGGNGNDVLIGGAGADTMYGYAGNDTFYVDNAGDKVIEAAGGGSDIVRTSVSYTLAAGTEIEQLGTTDSSGITTINLTGNEFGQILIGNAGANVLNGKGGADTLYGYAGNDTFYVDNAGDKVIEAVGGGSDSVRTSVSYALATGSEIELLGTTNSSGATAMNLTGNEFSQILVGNAGANVLNGKGGADTMYGYGGNDTFYVDNAGDKVIEAAGGGSDKVRASVSYALAAGTEIELLGTTNSSGTTAINLTGNEFGQTLVGNAGNNTVDGKAGNDTIYGYGGHDTIMFDTTLNASTNVDHIVDFSVANDLVDLAHSIFSSLPTGTLSPNAFYVGSAAHDADDRIIYKSANGAMFYDSNGNAAGGSTEFATLSAGLALTSTNFKVV